MATARSSASSVESPSPFSSSARTPAASHGLFSSVVSTARVSLRSVAPPLGLLLDCVEGQEAESNGDANHETEQEEELSRHHHDSDEMMENATTDY